MSKAILVIVVRGLIKQALCHRKFWFDSAKLQGRSDAARQAYIHSAKMLVRHAKICGAWKTT